MPAFPRARPLSLIPKRETRPPAWRSQLEAAIAEYAKQNPGRPLAKLSKGQMEWLARIQEAKIRQAAGTVC